jgi:prokaryotic ubiquitin-like protein Pup
MVRTDRRGAARSREAPLMASKDTGGQKRTSKTSEEVDEAQVDDTTDVAERKEKLDDDIDAMLDEIDDVLETNSEDFVRSFVQKGGE